MSLLLIKVFLTDYIYMSRSTKDGKVGDDRDSGRDKCMQSNSDSTCRKAKEFV